jgi:hypothetical protein
MAETSHPLTFVSLEGRRLSHARAELVAAPWGWQVELHDVAPPNCPLVRLVGRITLEMADGRRCEGMAIADLVAEDGSFVLLSGIGRLRLMTSVDAA